jgi:hypothetical protein
VTRSATSSAGHLLNTTCHNDMSKCKYDVTSVLNTLIISISNTMDKIVKCEYVTEDSYIGYKITTSKNKIISLLIDSDEGDYGVEIYFRKKEISDNNFTPFIGATIKNVKFGNTLINTHYFGARNIIIKTNRGNIRILIYNEHNGYFAHKYKATYNDKTVDDHL